MADLVFKINGADYPITDVAAFINSLTIDECGVYHQWTGSLIENIAEQDINSLMVAAFMQIAYMRGNPNVTQQAARQAIGASNLVDAISSFRSAGDDDADPPPPTPSEPAPNGSPENRLASSRSSGADSMTPSATLTNGQRDSGSPPWVPSVTSGSVRSAT